jgi:hypothetical protein
VFGYVYEFRPISDSAESNKIMCLVTCSGGAPGMANCGRRHTSERCKTHNFGTVVHYSDTVPPLFSTVSHNSVLARPPLLVT